MNTMVKIFIGLTTTLAVLAFSQIGLAGEKGNGNAWGKAISKNSVNKDISGDSCECDGKLTTLTLKYIGTTLTTVTVIQRNGDTIYTDNYLLPNETFAVTGTDQRGNKVSNTTLGTNITLYLGNGNQTDIHTSCSVEIKSGDVIGDFLVVTGTSRNNGQICAGPPPPCDPRVEECPIG